MKKKLIMALSSLALATALAACSETEEKVAEKVALTEEENHTEHKAEETDATSDTGKAKPIEDAETEQTQPATEKTVETVTKPEVKPEAKPEAKPRTEAVEDVEITSAEHAAEYLKTRLPEGKDEDVIFGVSPEADTDENGSYYFVRLSSLTLRMQGGTGTIETFKVYLDGSYVSTY